MTMQRSMPLIRAAALSALAAVVAPSSARAADASPWSDDLHSAARLLAGSGKADGGQWRGGIEVRMKPGWKTYWRYPGDSGVPPKFNFSGSTNLGAAKVLWPAPNGFSDETGISIGYKTTVIFPLEVIPREAGKPVTLKLKIDYAVCEKLCVPAQGEAELKLDGGASAHDGLLAAANAAVPKQVTAAEAGLIAKRVTGGIKPLVYLDVANPSGNAVQVFVEGPSPEWALPIPKPAPGAPQGRQHFSFELEGMPPGVDPKGAFELTFTIVGGPAPIAVTTRLD